MNDESSSSVRATLTLDLFTELVRECRTRLVNRVAYHFGYSLDAEHIVQQALLKAWNARARFDPRKGEFLSWITAIAFNTARDELRRRNCLGRPVTLEQAELADGLCSFEDPAELVERRRESDRLRNALARLPETDRRVICTLGAESRSLRATAAQLNLSVKQVRCARDRACRTLRHELKA